MHELIEYTKSQLIKHNIKEDLSDQIKSLKENLSTKDIHSAYLTLLHSLKERKMFLNILKNKTVFDIQIFIPKKKFFFKEEEIKKRLKEKLNFKYVYFSDNFIGIKLKEDCYDFRKNYHKELIPFNKLYRSIRKYVDFYELEFKELVYQMNHKCQSKEFIEYLKKIHLPVKIYDCKVNTLLSISNYQEINLILEEKEWPEEKNAQQCAKTAFYCYLHSKSQYSKLISKDHLIMKFNNTNFVLRIQTDTNLKNDFDELINNKEKWWKYNVKYVKTFLSSFGFYPFYFSDDLVNLLCYKIKDFYAPSFLKYFLSLDYNFNMKFDLKTENFLENEKDLTIQKNNLFYKINTPSKVIVNRLKLLNKKINESKFKVVDDNFNFITNDYLLPNIFDYDFVLSNKPRKNFDKLDYEGIFSFYELKELSNLCYLFYSERNGVILVKDDKIGIELLIGLIVNKSGFKYLYRNNK